MAIKHIYVEKDVPVLVLAYDANPSIFVSRKSAPKRATKGPSDLVQSKPGVICSTSLSSFLW